MVTGDKLVFDQADIQAVQKKIRIWLKLKYEQHHEKTCLLMISHHCVIKHYCMKCLVNTDVVFSFLIKFVSINKGTITTQLISTFAFAT